jgi:hypothetical protein
MDSYGSIINELGKDLDGSSCYLIEVLSWNLLGGTEENYDETQSG